MRCASCDAVGLSVRAGRRGVDAEPVCAACYRSALEHGEAHGMCSPALRAALVRVEEAIDALALIEDGGDHRWQFGDNGWTIAEVSR